MNITPNDNVDALIRQAENLKNIQTRIHQHYINLHNLHESDRIRNERLNRNREMAELDKIYYDKAYDKSKLVKGTNVDVYI
jgi:hypothetical protein